jgi:DHA2 family multidrug resistance protein
MSRLLHRPVEEPAVQAARPDRYPWIAMGVVLIGTYMVILDTTIVNVALPQIGTELHQSSGIEWIVTAYLLAVGTTQPATGWLADRVGRKRVFTGSLALFALGSLLAALAPNLRFLIVFRVFQGLGGGAMMPVGMAMIYELFPPNRRGTALGIWGISAMVAPAVGPALGGAIVTAASWRWLFLINVPLGIVGVIAATKLLRDTGYREDRPLDRAGLGLAAVGLFLLLLAFSNLTSWGWTSAQTLVTCGLGGALLAVFIWRELRIPYPMIDVRMFLIPTFNITIAIVWLITVMQFARLVFIPLELETLRHMTAAEVGLILTPAALGAAVTAPLGGRLADGVGARTPVMTGTVLIAVAAWFLAHLSPTTPVWRIMAILAVQGLGSGLSLTPNTVAAMNSVPGRLVAQASALRSLNRQIAGSFGVALLSSLVVSQIGAVSAADITDVSAGQIQGAYNLVFFVALASLGGALVLGWFLPGREQTRAMQAERANEAKAMEDLEF